MLCCTIIAMAQQITVPVVHYKDGTAKSFVNTSDIKFKYLKNATINLQPNELLNCCGSAFDTKYEATTTIAYYGEGKSLLIFSPNKYYSTSNWSVGINFGPISGKYNVYVETLPLTVLDPSATVKPVKFKASMSSNGTTLAQTASTIITDANNIATVKVFENVEIPEEADGNVVLTLQSNVSSRETGRYTRTMYIGSIVLEPVGENGNAAEPSNPAVVLDGKLFFPNADIDSVTVDVATLTLQNGNEEEFLKRRVHGTIHNYSKLKKLENVRFGLNVLDVAGSIKYFSIPSINPNCTSVQNGNNLAVTFTMPPADNSAYYNQLYLVIGEDSIVSDKKYIAPTAPYQSIDAALAKIIKQEQVPESYDLVSTVDITGLLEYLKTFNEELELEISGLEPTATPGIYTVTNELYLQRFEKDENLPVFPVGVTIINKTDNVKLERNMVSTTQTSFPYVKPKDVRKGRLPDFISKDAKLTLFSKALEATGLDYALVDFIDKTYTCGEDSVRGQIPAVRYGGCSSRYGEGMHQNESLRYPANRYFKFTAFAETDDVYARNGINTLEDLKAYAKSIYDLSYSEDAGMYDDDLTHPKNPLNRFMRYHFMDRFGTYDDWAPSGQIYANCWKPDVADAEDYWETMSGDMIRFCRLQDGSLYANSKAKGNSGIRVLNGTESMQVNPKYNIDMFKYSGYNGAYLYLDDILAYTPSVKYNVLNRRLRIDATTLSPDFMNQGARGNYEKEILCMFKNDYVKNFKLSKDTQIGVHSDDHWWSSYLGNAICIKGDFDFSVKLPTPPAGQYEVRLGYVSKYNGAIMQTFWNDKYLGEFDQTFFIWHLAEQIGKDKGIKNPNYTPDGWEPEYYFDLDDWYVGDNKGHTASESEEHNALVDTYLREYGYMKAMDSYRKGTGSTSFRVDGPESLRRIFGTVNIKDGEECWLRFKNLTANPDQEFSFDYIELVPVGVIQAGEDRH